MRTTITISGMTSVHAVRAVFTALSGIDGITRADVSLGAAVIDHDGRATEEALRAAVELAGCEVTALASDARALPLL